MLIMSTNSLLLLVIAFVYGLLMGSFLNVVIYRLPRELNIARPWRSFCPACYSALSFFSLIPIIGYLAQGRKCSICNANISLQYPLVELTSAIITAFIIWYFGLTINTLFLLTLTYGLICLFTIDARQQLLPDKITLSLLWLGLLFNLKGGFVSLDEAVLGAILGYISLWSIYWVHKLITKREGMGYGDFKLMAMLGAWLGVKSLLPLMLISAISGIIYAVVTSKRSRVFAFGPFLIIGASILLVKNNMFFNH